MKLKNQYRNLSVRAGDVDTEKRTINLSFSSEEPVARWFGSEILDHKAGSVDLTRLNDSAPFLVDHDTRSLAGVVESAKIDGKRGVAEIRMGNSDFANEILQDINDGIRKNISFGYRINKMVLESTSEAEGDVYRATSWMPFEISSVPIPADNSVGIGRSESEEEYEVEVEKPTEEVIEETSEDSQEAKPEIEEEGEKSFFSIDLETKKWLLLQKSL